EESCVTCGGAHAYYNCPNTDRNQPSLCAATGTYNQVAPQNRASNFMAPPGFAPGEMKVISTCSGVAYEGPLIPTPKKVVEGETEETMDKEQTNFQGSTAYIQPLVTPVGNKMHKAFPLPVMEFPLSEEVLTASEESSHYQKKKDAPAEKIALLLKSSSNCQSKSYDSYAKLVPHV
nr:hypothetical protein [Tanacetum cinerariifolium]